MTIRLAEGLYVLSGAVNTGVLVRDGAALLFDCCDTVTPTRLAELGAESVETILCTQHRRPNVAGAYPFVAAGARLVVPEHERALFEDVDRYWADWRNRWHVYRHQPGPQVLARPLSVAETVDDGATLSWRGHTIQVLATPGATDGSVTYLLELGGRRIAFCGDLICGPGQLWEVHALQKGYGGIMDYHGFLGNRHRLLPSLRRLRAAGCDVLVPSHGPTIEEPSGAMDLLLQRLDALWRNYTSISALNHYFPNLLDETRNDPQRMAPAETCEPPSWVRRVAFTSYAVVSESGALFLLDCGHDIVVDQLQRWLAHGAIRSVEGCWVTHYHDDHVDSLHRLATAFGCPILA
ncbi:MAG: MBL fold metallo-hydrolase, partial [Chloroflexi bacterium]|nr:MBL fold metallo-hydrolase [Chloroflexota bacterium]